MPLIINDNGVDREMTPEEEAKYLAQQEADAAEIVKVRAAHAAWQSPEKRLATLETKLAALERKA